MAFVRRETSEEEEEEEEEADGAVAGSATGKKRASPFLYCCKSYERGTKKGRESFSLFLLLLCSSSLLFCQLRLWHGESWSLLNPRPRGRQATLGFEVFIGVVRFWSNMVRLTLIFSI